MEDLEHHEEYILDNKNCITINTRTSCVLYFDFTNMSFKEGSKKTLKPIRYDVESELMLYWGDQRWRPFSPTAKGVVKRLFNNYHERTLLGENNE